MCTQCEKYHFLKTGLASYLCHQSEAIHLSMFLLLLLHCLGSLSSTEKVKKYFIFYIGKLKKFRRLQMRFKIERWMTSLFQKLIRLWSDFRWLDFNKQIHKSWRILRRGPAKFCICTDVKDKTWSDCSTHEHCHLTKFGQDWSGNKKNLSVCKILVGSLHKFHEEYQILKLGKH